MSENEKYSLAIAIQGAIKREADWLTENSPLYYKLMAVSEDAEYITKIPRRFDKEGHQKPPITLENIDGYLSASGKNTLKPKDKTDILKILNNPAGAEASIMQLADGRFYRFGKALGAGGFGKVIVLEDIETGEKKALKVQRVTNDDKKASRLRSALSETAFTEENLPDYFQGTQSREQAGKSSEQKEYLAMTLFEGPGVMSLQALIENIHAGNIAISRETLDALTHHIIQTFAEIQNKNIVHGDIKPDNIMIDVSNPQSPKAFIIDWGFARKIQPYEDRRELQRSGTPGYIDPLIFKQNAEVSLQSDRFALGVTIASLYAVAGVIGEFKPNEQISHENIFAVADMSEGRQLVVHKAQLLPLDEEQTTIALLSDLDKLMHIAPEKRAKSLGKLEYLMPKTSEAAKKEWLPGFKNATTTPTEPTAQQKNSPKP